MQPDVETTNRWLCSFRVGPGFKVSTVNQVGSGGPPGTVNSLQMGTGDPLIRPLRKKEKL